MSRSEFSDVSKSHAEYNNKGSNLIVPLVFLAILAIALAIGGAILLREYYGSRELARTAVSERNAIAARSDSLMAELNSLDTAFKELTNENESLRSQADLHRREISRLRQELRYFQTLETDTIAGGVKAQIAYLEKELERLRGELGSIQNEHSSVVEANLAIQAALNSSQLRVAELERVEAQLNQKLSSAHNLSIVDLNAITLRADGDLSDRARRVNRIKACFTIVENLIAAPGERTFYLRITSVSDPEGFDIQSAGNFTSADGEVKDYQVSKVVNFQNQEMEECLGILLEVELRPGTYRATIYQNGLQLRSREFQLR
ncbi:MAG TPA: hypothetical protein DCM62_04660 [Bacteroidales bacterium]|nr:hypothetical protein [Bacteroidales bacterium]